MTTTKSVIDHVTLHGHNTIKGFESVAIPAIDFFDLVGLCGDRDNIIAAQLRMLNKEIKGTKIKMIVFRSYH